MGISDIPLLCSCSALEETPTCLLPLKQPGFFAAAWNWVFFCWRTKNASKNAEISTWLLVGTFFSCLVISWCLQDANVKETQNMKPWRDVGISTSCWGGVFFFFFEAFPSGGCGWRWAVPDILGSFVVVVHVVKLWSFFEIINPFIRV